MTDIFVFADETGDLGYNLKSGSRYFGFGTATIRSSHSEVLWDSFSLRCFLESQGVELPSGFHATEDSRATKDLVFQLIAAHKPRFDFTFLDKSQAVKSLSEKGDLHLYRLAWYLHFKFVAQEIATPDDTIYAISAAIKTKSKSKQIVSALKDVAEQVTNRRIIPMYWNSSSSWGLQMADYGLWEAQRKINQLNNLWWDRCISPTTKSFFTPWNTDEHWKARLSLTRKDPLDPLLPG